jgi:hypothetical protein
MAELGVASVELCVGNEFVAWGVLVLTGGVAAVGLAVGDEFAVGVLTDGDNVSWVEGLFASPQPMSAIKQLAIRVISSLPILKPVL